MQRNRILIVDDSRVVRVALARMLGEQFSILQASDGLEAWALLLEQPEIGLVLSDWSMPNLDGLGLIRRIRSGQGITAGVSPRLPVVLITGQNSETAAGTAELRAQGADEVLVKPFQAQQVRALAATLLAGQSSPLAADPSETIATLRAELENLQSELLLRQLTQNERTVQSEIRSLRARCLSCEQENAHLRLRAEHAEIELDRQQQLDHEARVSIVEMERLQQELSAMTEIRNALLREVADLHRSEAQLSRSRDVARQAAARCESELREARADHAAEHTRLRALAERFEAHERRRHELESHAISLRQQLDDAELRAATAARAAAQPGKGAPRTETWSWADARHSIVSPGRHWVRLAFLASLAANLLLAAAFLILWFAGRA